jgi:hypothetical protein
MAVHHTSSTAAGAAGADGFPARVDVRRRFVILVAPDSSVASRDRAPGGSLDRAAAGREGEVPGPSSFEAPIIGGEQAESTVNRRGPHPFLAQ